MLCRIKVKARTNINNLSPSNGRQKIRKGSKLFCLLVSSGFMFPDHWPTLRICIHMHWLTSPHAECCGQKCKQKYAPDIRLPSEEIWHCYLVSRKYKENVWIMNSTINSEKCPVVGCCEHDCEPLSSIKSEGISWLLERSSASQEGVYLNQSELATLALIQCGVLSATRCPPRCLRSLSKVLGLKSKLFTDWKQMWEIPKYLWNYSNIPKLHSGRK
jgi:hypothetical protein